MRYIKIPEDILVTPPPEYENEKAESCSFRKFARFWLDDVRAMKDGDEFSFTKQCRWAGVVSLINKSAPGDTIALEDEDFAVLKAIVERPTRVLPTLVSVQLIPFSKAVLDAASQP